MNPSFFPNSRSMIASRFHLAAFAALGAVIFSHAVEAQRPGGLSTTPASTLASRPLGTIDGIVSDTGLAPLQGAFVTVFGSNLRVGTGPNGRFRITKIPVGQYLLMVKRFGFRPASAIIQVSETDTLRLSYTLEPISPEQLNAVVVTEKAPSIRMSEFEQRRKLGQGEFMTADEIKERNSAFPTELFRKFKSVNVTPDNSTPIIQYYAISAREGGNPQLGACPMQVYLDQVPLPSPFNLDLLPSPHDIGGIEVYAGASTIPLQFAGFDRGCGVILVWTKDSSVF
jgi:Carboxypeptidase regulatory-like domain